MNHSFEWFFSVNRLAKIEWFIRERDWPCSSCYWVTCEVLSFIIKPSELDCAEDLTDGSRSKLEDQCSTYSKHISDMVTFSEIHMDLFMFLMLQSSWTPQLCNSNNTYANAILLEMHYWDMTWLITSPCWIWICFCGPPNAINVRAPVFTDYCEISLQIVLIVFSAH